VIWDLLSTHCDLLTSVRKPASLGAALASVVKSKMYVSNGLSGHDLRRDAELLGEVVGGRFTWSSGMM